MTGLFAHHFAAQPAPDSIARREGVAGGGFSCSFRPLRFALAVPLVATGIVLALAAAALARAASWLIPPEALAGKNPCARPIPANHGRENPRNVIHVPRHVWRDRVTIGPLSPGNDAPVTARRTPTLRGGETPGPEAA